MPNRRLLIWYFISALLLVAQLWFWRNQFLNGNTKAIENGWFVSSGDTRSYYEPMERYARGEGYSVAHELTKQVVPAGFRMPGLLPFYGTFRLFFSESESKVAMIWLQIALSFLTLWLVGQLALWLIPDDDFAGLTMLIWSLSSLYQIYSFFGLSESLSAFTFMFSVFFLLRFLRNGALWLLVASGSLLGLSIFIRPVVGFNLLLFSILIVAVRWKPNSGKLIQHIKRLALFGIVPALMITGWTVRNFLTFEKFIPLQMPNSQALPGTYPDYRMACYDLISSLGQNMVDFSNYTMGDWFMEDSYRGEFPLHILPTTSVFNTDSIVNLKADFLRSRTLPIEERLTLGASILKRAEAYRTSIRRELPFHFYVVAPLKSIGYFLFHPRLNLPLPLPKLQDMGFHEKALKGFNFLLLWWVVIVGLIGAIWWIFQRNFSARWWIVLPLGFVLAIPLLTGYVEQRYLLHPYLLLIAPALYFTWRAAVLLPFIPAPKWLHRT